MGSQFFPGLRILFIGHGECILWYNYCRSCNISNLGYPPLVEIRVLARTAASLKFFTDKAPVIFQFRPHVIVLHLGMYDLLKHNSNPFAVADRYWHAVGLISACLAESTPVRVVFIGQPRFPWHLVNDRMYGERVEAFHSRLLRRAEGSSFFTFLFMTDIWRNSSALTTGVGGINIFELSPYEWPLHMYLSGIMKHIAIILSPQSEYVLLFLSDVFRDYSFF